MAIPVQTFIDRLTESHRVVVLGGLAVIVHGYSRHTHVADVWLDPMESPEVWCEWQVLVAAQENPLEEVRELARTHLREFAAAGDPFSQAILEGREIP